MPDGPISRVPSDTSLRSDQRGPAALTLLAPPLLLSERFPSSEIRMPSFLVYPPDKQSNANGPIWQERPLACPREFFLVFCEL
jgi:hypothetical protein